MPRIAVLVGSLRSESINKRYIKKLEELLPEGTEFDYVDLNLPLYNADLEQNLPAEVAAGKQIVEAADGVLFVTPEYNRGMTGVLKNATDWISRPWGSNSFNGKPTAIIGVSGSLGTTQAQQQLRNVLLHLNMKVMGQPEMYINGSVIYDEAGEMTEEAAQFARQFIEAFTNHIMSNKTD